MQGHRDNGVCVTHTLCLCALSGSPCLLLLCLLLLCFVICSLCGVVIRAQIVKRDNSWNEGAGRELLLQIFEVLGQSHELTVDGRKRLAGLLFR